MSISLPSRGSFHLSLTVLVHYRSRTLFSLGEWSPQLHTGFHVADATQENNDNRVCISNTGLSPSLAGLSRTFLLYILFRLKSRTLFELFLTTPEKQRRAA
jgi:hypothetical protein